MRGRTNCYIQARREYERRVEQWRLDPDPNRSPYFLERPSHLAPVPHYCVGWGDPGIDAVRVDSFVPHEKVRRARWWQAPVLFCGHWDSSDTKHAPLDLPPPRPILALTIGVRLMRLIRG